MRKLLSRNIWKSQKQTISGWDKASVMMMTWDSQTVDGWDKASMIMIYDNDLGLRDLVVIWLKENTEDRSATNLIFPVRCI